jgi:UDP-3-O-[3-hydroxymyristoyl] glucosamine N-acyltransferase
MYRLKKPDIHASEIAGYLNADLMGIDFIVNLPCSANNCTDNSFFYLEGDVTSLKRINKFKQILIFADKEINIDFNNYAYIKIKNPKLDFIRVVNEFFIDNDNVRISDSAKIHPKAQIGRNVFVGENVVIGPDVVIDTNTKIFNNVVISSRVEIGKNSIIKDNSTIGSAGYDFESDEKGNPLHYPHIGKIIIGDNVWIGANSSIESAKLDDTLICDFVKIDDLVQIGYNCFIGERSMITAGAIISRDVHIGENTLISPNSSIRNNIRIGNNSIIGLGAVVIEDVPDDSVFAGNPAHLLRSKKKGE